MGTGGSNRHAAQTRAQEHPASLQAPRVQKSTWLGHTPGCPPQQAVFLDHLHILPAKREGTLPTKGIATWDRITVLQEGLSHPRGLWWPGGTLGQMGPELAGGGGLWVKGLGEKVP